MREYKNKKQFFASESVTEGHLDINNGQSFDEIPADILQGMYCSNNFTASILIDTNGNMNRHVLFVITSAAF